MVSVCFYFQVHQPFRVRKYSVFDIGEKRDYFSDKSDSNLNNEKIIKKVSEKCYLPANKVMLELIKRYPQFKISYSLSGVLLEQLEQHAPTVLDSFKALADTGNVEFLNETSHHSLSFIFSKPEFRDQVLNHRKKIKHLFNQSPKVFRNTELIYNNDLANEVSDMGFKATLLEGADHVLGWRSPNFVYHSKNNPNMKLLLKNYRLSDDIAFRFSERSWEGWPLTAPKFASWVNAINGDGNTVNLFMDYETFGEHQWESTGIFEFLRALPEEILKHKDNDFKTPSEVIESYPAVGEVDVPHFMSWADIERDLSAWLGNPLQDSAISSLYKLRDDIIASGDEELIELWRKLQTSDHFYYMCTKWFADGDVHKYFNPYESPYEAFISFMNVIHDMKLRVDELKDISNQNIYKPESI